jgi:hypothetical protein
MQRLTVRKISLLRDWLARAGGGAPERARIARHNEEGRGGDAALIRPRRGVGSGQGA